MSVTVLVTAAKVRWIVPLNQCQDSALIDKIRLLSNLLLLLFAIKGYFPTFVGMERITNYGMENNAGMSLCTAGSREVLINGQLYRIKKDMLCFSSPIISIYELSRSEDYDETTIYDSPEVFYQAIKLMFDMILSFRLRNNPCLLLDAVHVRFFVERKSMIDRKREYLEGIQNKEERQLVQSIIHLLEQETMLEFIHLYYQNCIVEPEPMEKNEAIAYKFIYSLHLHVKTERSVSFYANEANLSSSHFTRIVKDKTGKTPSEWIADMTVVNAKLLLEQSGMSIKEIAAELNFPEQFTFRKFFKLHVGVPPKEYRLKNRAKE